MPRHQKCPHNGLLPEGAGPKPPKPSTRPTSSRRSRNARIAGRDLTPGRPGPPWQAAATGWMQGGQIPGQEAAVEERQGLGLSFTVSTHHVKNPNNSQIPTSHTFPSRKTNEVNNEVNNGVSALRNFSEVLEWPGRAALEKSYFRRSYCQKDSTTTLTYHDRRTLFLHWDHQFSPNLQER